MRLTRLASVTRNISSRADEDLAHRLQQGLPETTYAKAEAYYTRQAHTKTQLALNADTASQASRNVAKIVVQPPSEEQTTLSQKRRRDVIDDDNQIEAERRPLKTTSRASVVGHDASHGQNGVKQPLVTVPNDTTGLSPQSIAVAALIEQHLHNAAPSRSALTPSKVNLSSAGNREPLTERGSVKSSIPNGNSGDSKTCPSDPTMRSTSEAAVKHASSQFARPFPFRQGQIVKEQSDSRIIDRRRARNEELRRKYMKKRMDQQRAQEAKAAKREAEQNGQAASDLADAEKPQAGTPDSGTSQASATSLSNISSPPASLRNLLNDST